MNTPRVHPFARVGAMMQHGSTNEALASGQLFVLLGVIGAMVLPDNLSVVLLLLVVPVMVAIVMETLVGIPMLVLLADKVASGMLYPGEVSSHVQERWSTFTTVSRLFVATAFLFVIVNTDDAPLAKVLMWSTVIAHGIITTVASGLYTWIERMSQEQAREMQASVQSNVVYGGQYPQGTQGTYETYPVNVVYDGQSYPANVVYGGQTHYPQ